MHVEWRKILLVAFWPSWSLNSQPHIWSGPLTLSVRHLLLLLSPCKLFSSHIAPNLIAIGFRADPAHDQSPIWSLSGQFPYAASLPSLPVDKTPASFCVVQSVHRCPSFTLMYWSSVPHSLCVLHLFPFLIVLHVNAWWNRCRYMYEAVYAQSDVFLGGLYHLV